MGESINEKSSNGTNLFGEDEEMARTGKEKPIVTLHEYMIDEVKSALQKAIRRGNEEGAMFWAVELAESGLSWSLWQRLKAIAIEDCAGMEPIVFVSQCAFAALKSREGSMYAAKAALELARAPKDRTADDFICWMVDGRKQGEFVEPVIPDIALDKHTKRGRKMGRGGSHFFHVGAVLKGDTSRYDTKYLKVERERFPLTPNDENEDVS